MCICLHLIRLYHLEIIYPRQIVKVYQFHNRSFQSRWHLTMSACMPDLFANTAGRQLSGTLMSVNTNIRLCILVEWHLATSMTFLLFNLNHLVQSSHLCNGAHFLGSARFLIHLIHIHLWLSQGMMLLCHQWNRQAESGRYFVVAFSTFLSPILVKAALFDTL